MNIGGAIGIWLGLSILSLIQVITWFELNLIKDFKGAGYVMELVAGCCNGEKTEKEEEEVLEEDDRKFSANPFGPPTLSSNPLGDIAAPPARKRSTVNGA